MGETLLGNRRGTAPAGSFSSGAVEEQSAEGALPVWEWDRIIDERLHCIRTKQVAASGNATRTDARRAGQGFVFPGRASELLCVPDLSYVYKCASVIQLSSASL